MKAVKIILKVVAIVTFFGAIPLAIYEGVMMIVKGFDKKRLAWLLAALGSSMIMIMALASDSGSTQEDVTPPAIVEEVEEVEEEEVVVEEEEEEQEEEVKVTREQKNALKKAESYLKIMNFSYPGLEDQLEFEGFPKDAIEYAMANIIVDWNEQALAKANSYLSISAMSDESLRQQLDFEGFTKEQIDYAINNLED